jgi:S-formylglutathione hydrolase FrmB
MLDESVISGTLPALASLAGVLAFGFLLVRPYRNWWRIALPVSVGGSILAVLIADLVLEVWQPFPDPLPFRVLFWSGFGVLGVAMGGAQAVPANWRRRLAIVLAILLVIVLSAVKINAFYGYRPTLRAALGISAEKEVDFASLAGTKPRAVTAPDRPLSQSWRPPVDMPRAGQLTRVTIPGTRSGFRARPASVYLPPAYLASSRPLLPVLVLIAGQPGGPQDWLVAGTLAKVMDAFANAHAGLAPIVVVPDATGSTLANPMCLDSRLGNVESYLADDVPGWVRNNLQIDPDTRHWAIGGFSYGGTCSLQLAVRRARTYPTFLDISGQREPTLGSRTQTVQAAFGGDDSRFRAVNPLDILLDEKFRSSAGIVAVGADDRDYGPQAEQVTAATRNAGIAIQLVRLPGGHSWTIAASALRAALPWLGARGGLIPTP